MALRPAERKQSKMILGLSAPSGAGKTKSALRMAYGITGDWTKIAMIDTENGSGDLYSDMGPYNVITMKPPYSPEAFIANIEECEDAGMEVIIIDSTTHEWEGEGWCLQMNEAIAKTKFGGNTYMAWSVTGARHQKFIDKILHSRCHIITTVRNKTETAQIDDGGKKKVVKLWVKEIQREGFEYELTINFNIVRDWHYAMASKDRTGLFIDRDPFVITEETGKELIEWNRSGAKVIQPPTQQELFDKFDTLLKECTTLEELKTCYLEVVANKSALGENFYKSLASLKDDMKTSIEENILENISSEITESITTEFENIKDEDDTDSSTKFRRKDL